MASNTSPPAGVHPPQTLDPAGTLKGTGHLALGQGEIKVSYSLEVFRVLSPTLDRKNRKDVLLGPMLFSGTIRAAEGPTPALTPGQEFQLRLNGIAVTVKVESQDNDEVAVKGEIAEVTRPQGESASVSAGETPVWIQQRNVERQRKLTRATERLHEEEQIGILVSVEGPAVWQTFIRGLALNAESLSKLDGEGVSGIASTDGEPGAETSCHVTVNGGKTEDGPLMNATFFYEHGSPVIRVRLLHGAESLLPLRPHHLRWIGIYYEGRVMEPQHMAQVVIEKMVRFATPVL